MDAIAREAHRVVLGTKTRAPILPSDEGRKVGEGETPHMLAHAFDLFCELRYVRADDEDTGDERERRGEEPRSELVGLSAPRVCLSSEGVWLGGLGGYLVQMSVG